MAIILSENLQISSPRPTRTTDIVGTSGVTGSPDAVYDTKESIPAYMRYLYMEVTDETGTIWRLEDKTDLTIWTEQTSGGDVNTDVIASVDVGGINLGETVTQGTDLTEFVQQLISPLIMPSIAQNNYVILSGITTSTVEVGMAFTATLNTNYSRGAIDSKDSSPDVPLTGAATTETYSGPGVQAGGAVVTPIVPGSNQWGVVQNYGVENIPYYDSKGDEAHNLDSFRGPGSVSDSSEIITGKYRYWFSVGSIPTDSISVRNLPNHGFLPAAYFDIPIPIGQKEIGIYVLAGSTVKVLYIESSNADVTSTFDLFSMHVNDAGGIPVSYLRMQTIIPGIGYTQNATYRVIIT